MPGNIAQEIVVGSGQTYGIVVMATGNKTINGFTQYMNQAVGTVGTGYINAKWNERNDAQERNWYSS